MHRSAVRYLLIATKDAKSSSKDTPAASPVEDTPPNVGTTDQPTGPATNAGQQWAGDPINDRGKITDPEKAFASFSGDQDEKAWLDRAQDGTMTGWVTDSTGQTYRYSDVDAWAVDVDDATMKRTGGTGPDTTGTDETDSGAADTKEPGSATSSDINGADADQMSLLKEGKSLVLSVKHMGEAHDQSVHGTRAAGRHNMTKRSEAGRLPRPSHQIVATDMQGHSVDGKFRNSPEFKPAAAPEGLAEVDAPGGLDEQHKAYADPGLQADGKARLPVGTHDEACASIGYLTRKRNADRYAAEHLATVKDNLRAAAKKHGIDATI